ncbi:MAG: polyisoprenoid-binding protein [Anaerolineales bacterium]|nr:polyisoprenoid-binding protein [Anaerolineales bacterium]
MTWNIDASHTRANFSVRHMMISNVHGQFDDISGTVEFNEADPAQSSLNVKIGVASINTRDEKRDGHLKSPDFFDVANHPYLTFESAKVEKASENTGRVTGNLTIRGVSKPVVLDVEYNGQAKSPWGTTSAGFTATAKINRKDWGLNWNVALETGGVLVGDEVKITIEAEIVKQPEAVAAASA